MTHTDLPRCHEIVEATLATDQVSLTYAERLLRRKRLVGQSGQAFIVDLAHVQSVDEGQAFLLETGHQVAILAADEDLLEIRGPLLRLAWHIGNRHTPCEMGADVLRIQADHVLEKMLKTLGAEVTAVRGSFRPEGGAYGHGRTMGHGHSHDH